MFKKKKPGPTRLKDVHLLMCARKRASQLTGLGGLPPKAIGGKRTREVVSCFSFPNNANISLSMSWLVTAVKSWSSRSKARFFWVVPLLPIVMLKVRVSFTMLGRPTLSTKVKVGFLLGTSIVRDPNVSPCGVVFRSWGGYAVTDGRPTRWALKPETGSLQVLAPTLNGKHNSGIVSSATSSPFRLRWLARCVKPRLVASSRDPSGSSPPP